LYAACYGEFKSFKAQRWPLSIECFQQAQFSGRTFKCLASEVKFGKILALRTWLALSIIFGAWVAQALEWEIGPGYRRAPLQPVGSGTDGFTLMLPEQTGILFSNSVSEQRLLASQILPNGSGVAAGDVDGDGRCDLYFCGLKCGNRLYRNLGNWKFEDITEWAGVACSNLDCTSAALVDIDGNGTLDLIVNSLGGGTHIFFNDGQGHFTESKEILNSGLGGMSMALADIDGDGWLDLYIANYRVSTVLDMPDVRFNLRMVNGNLVVASVNNRPLTDPEWTNRFRFNVDADRGKFTHEELGEPDALFRNTGGGRFVLVPFTGGNFLDEDGKTLSQPPLDWGLSVMFRDLNQDGKPDLYVCNDFNTPDRIWLNDGNGRFRAMPRLGIRQTPYSSMAVDVADINRDGLDDLFVGDMLSRVHGRRLIQRLPQSPDVAPLGAVNGRRQYSRNTVQLNRGDGTYAEVAQFCGLEASEWSWTPIFLDVDLDGYEDLLIGNGFVRDNMNLDGLNAVQQASMAPPHGASVAFTELRRLFPPLATANLAFRNLGGLKFVETGHQWRFDTKVISQGMCLADLDNDGDMDVVANNLNAPAGIYRNDTAKPRIAVTLKGRTHNTQGIGAKIRVYGGPVAMQSQEVISGGRYLSCDQAMRVFAAGSLTNRLRIEVDWPSAKRSRVEDAAANYLYEIDEAGAVPAVAAPVKIEEPWFADVSQLLSHRHHEEPFDDFARQPTLPKRLSQLGPGVCWCDLNGDGWDDLVIGSGKGGSLGVFLNDGKGGFRPSTGDMAGRVVARDQTAVIALSKISGLPSLLVGSASYEDSQSSGACVQEYNFGSGQITELISGTEASVGPLALGDLDGDGNLDLFVGGRVKPGRYPEAVSSRIYRGRDGAFVLDEPNSKAIENIGLVSGAVWSDLDGDGFPELILACEWGPIRIFHNDHGHLGEYSPQLSFATPNSQNLTLNRLTGWWNGVTTGDLDGDGRLDIIASNWGENSKYQSHRTAPLRLYYGDFDDSGALGLIEAYFEPELRKYVPERRLDIAARSMPFLRARFPTYAAYAAAGVDEILVNSNAPYLEANWLESTAFLNRGSSFEARILPEEAQFAPAFAVVVADYDGDGKEDLFLSQNFFAVEPETSRYDAGRGLWLKGDGQGGFRPVPGQSSGIMIYGEQRGAAVSDFDGDGRVDLVVTQNSAETRLFKNRLGKPGLRVRLKGPPGNPWGIGAQMRVKYGDRMGPLREIHGGGSYWSEDSPVQVLANAETQSRLWLRWPGGKTMMVNVPVGAAEIQVGIDGAVTKLKDRQAE
jgi:hypothetical protein